MAFFEGGALCAERAGYRLTSVLPVSCRIWIFTEVFFVCPKESGIVAEAAAETDLGYRQVTAQQFLGHQEALLIYVAVDGITSFLFEETHHMEFTQEKPGGQTVNCEVGGRIFRDIAHDFQNLFAAGAGAYIFQMAPGRSPVQMDHKLQKKNTAVQFFGIAVFPACFFKADQAFIRETRFSGN